MAKITAADRQFVSRVAQSIRDALKQVGIEAEVQTEPVTGTRLHRIMVAADAFEHLRPSERQDLVWRIVGQSFLPQDQLRISMILTMTPAEMAGTAVG